MTVDEVVAQGGLLCGVLVLALVGFTFVVRGIAALFHSARGRA